MPPMHRYLTSMNSSTPYFEPGRRCPSYSRRDDFLAEFQQPGHGARTPYRAAV